ncbi:MerR family transcriptional regulator [Micromonospora echinospora]|uniref:DNA-binding transcriptional regulator, MerR family n=1 Tax=Micromonospora echinospora TaxID=1877 RepID=A0A1C4ZLS2_MICEC|nr:MerR family transcriptional regulator [Micromonospora echinospora]OZV81530.1 MerR family transcriptional regulator [Micromonospora echinospora]SCF33839.1 DNA-binding transcriptional regulator, MerR family [Micromonospora echinospora]
MVEPSRLRAVDLAASVGISVQQVRNYVDLGVLPPVTRTPAGYRVFTAAHAEALVVVRRMAEGHGWARTREVMAAAHGGDLATALAALDRGHAELDRERAEIRRVLGAFDTVVAGPAVTVPARRRGVRIGEVADLVGVRTSLLRLWERRGLLRPVRERGTSYRLYDAAELRAAQVVALLRRGGYPFDIVASVLGELRTTGSPQRVRAELARREQELHRRSLTRLAASAALYDYLRRRGLVGGDGPGTRPATGDWTRPLVPVTDAAPSTP